MGPPVAARSLSLWLSASGATSLFPNEPPTGKSETLMTLDAAGNEQVVQARLGQLTAADVGIRLQATAALSRTFPYNEGNMRRLWMLTCALVFCLLLAPGCLSDDSRRQWAAAWADLRGDNMEMGSHEANDGKIAP
jgi:hypothetical protein